MASWIQKWRDHPATAMATPARQTEPASRASEENWWDNTNGEDKVDTAWSNESAFSEPIVSSEQTNHANASTSVPAYGISNSSRLSLSSSTSILTRSLPASTSDESAWSSTTTASPSPNSSPHPCPITSVPVSDNPKPNKRSSTSSNEEYFANFESLPPSPCSPNQQFSAYPDQCLYSPPTRPTTAKAWALEEQFSAGGEKNEAKKEKKRSTSMDVKAKAPSYLRRP